jgi:archaellum component FlaG (FlaF/FlaG flagellin family)
LATGVPTRAAIAAMKAVARTLARTTTILGRWLKPRADMAADEFAKSFGKLAAAAIVGYASGADKQLTILIKMIGQFLGTH